MKESDINKMSLAEINRKMGMSARIEDFSAIIQTNDEKLIESFIRNIRKSSDVYQVLRTEFKGDESKINKLALIIITLDRYLANYEGVIKTLNANKNATPEEIKNREAVFNRYIKTAKDILKDIDKTIYILKFNSEGLCFIETINSQELVQGKKKSQNARKLKELREKGLGLIEVANSIVLTDLANIICDSKLGEHMRYQAFYNSGLKKGVISRDNEMFYDPEAQINALRDKLEYIEMLPEIERILEDNIEYYDFDKLLLCSAYRHIEFLETTTQIPEEAEEEFLRRLTIIQEYLRGKNVKLQGRLEKQNYDEMGSYEFIDISYKVRDFERDMQKYRGKTYYGRAKVADIKAKLLSGEILFDSLEFREIKLNPEEKMSIAVANNDNYVYLIQNGLIDKNTVTKINEFRQGVSKECLQALLENKILTEKQVIELYLTGKAELNDVFSINLDLKECLTIEDIHSEFSKEDNEDRQKRISELYKKIIEKQNSEEKMEEEKQRIYDVYLNSLDAKYLEIFTKLDVLSFGDLQGIMTAKEWMESLERSEISEQFFFELQKNRIIEAEDIKQDKKMLSNELKLWEDGVVTSHQIELLGISIDELFEMCDKGEITGRRIYELLHSEEEKDSVRRKLKSCYTYGMFSTIKPGFVGYNNNLLSRDNIVALINQMKISEKEIVDACFHGFLSGERIAELYYQHLISKRAYLKVKETGAVTEEEEISVLNNLTPEEMIAELEENGCKQIVDIEEIIRESTSKKGHSKKREDIKFGYRKQVINPIARNKLLEALGADKIVTTPEQGFKGYQVYLIPGLNIAVMEKLFRLNKEKEVKPSYGDATYICELGKFLLIAGQSKQEIRAFMELEGTVNGKVEIIEHRKNWGSKLIDAISKVNPKVCIQKDRNKKIQQILTDGHDINIDIQNINELIENIQRGNYSLYLEDYE